MRGYDSGFSVITYIIKMIKSIEYHPHFYTVGLLVVPFAFVSITFSLIVTGKQMHGYDSGYNYDDKINYI